MPRKPKSQDENPYEIIRGMWEGAYVSHFVRLFQKKFGFSCITTQDLEDALVIEESVVLADVCARLLRYLTGNRNILIANFDSFLRNLLIKKKAVVPRYLDNGTTWQDLTPEEKLSILKWLVDYVHQEKEEDIADFLDENYSPEDLRGICAGQDAFNNVYWYLDDLRLYRECAKRQNKKEWECVCLTLADWYSFLKKFRKTTNLQEKKLYTYLNFELFPIIEVELINTKKERFPNKEAENTYLINQEQEELVDMLEKTFVECSNGLVKSFDVTDTESDCHETHNGTVTTGKLSNDENEVADLKSGETKQCNEMNQCDGHITMSEAMSSGTDLSVPSVDITTSGTSAATACVGSCPTNTQASKISHESNGVCDNRSSCSNSTSSVIAGTVSGNRNVAEEVNLQQPASDNRSDSGSIASNKENAPPAVSLDNTGNDVPPMSAMSDMVGSTSTPATATIQPLPSNMVNKTSFPLETQYMQQQSQIFVFSTELANKAAESCLSGHFSSIIAFHCAQPGTKSFLEKYPLKVQQFNRQNPAAWLNSLASMKQGGRPVKGTVNQFHGNHGITNRFIGPSSGGTAGLSCLGSCGVHGANMCSGAQGQWPNVVPGSGQGMIPGMCTSGNPQQWAHQHFSPAVNPRFPNSVSQGMNLKQVGPSGSPMLTCTGSVGPNIGMAFPGAAVGASSFSQNAGGPSVLTGVKVPDENLTPEQRQHREEQLATIRKMQQMLFPEQQLDHLQSGMSFPPASIALMSSGVLQHGSHPRFGMCGNTCAHSGVDTCFSPHQSCLNDHEHSQASSDAFINSGIMASAFNHQNYPPVSVAAQLKWQELQHQFYEERQKKHNTCTALSHSSSISQTQLSHSSHPHPPLQPQLVNSPGPNVGLSPGSRCLQGPPPPYHQTSKRSISSPHPASPNPSSLSLSSPCVVSGLSSPADPSRHFPHPTPYGPRLPHPSPGATTPVGSNSLHTTPLNSPKPLNSSSGPGSNSGSLIKTPTTPSNTASTPTGTPTSSCMNAAQISSPNVSVGQCASNRKQLQQCSDIQEADAATSTANAEFIPASGPLSVTSTAQGDTFCHGVYQCSQQNSKQEHAVPHVPSLCQKEPSLMPVPSPQQIQYLNAFDAQELTIQKQPNTSIREIDMMSPASVPPSVVMSSGSHFQSPDPSSFPNTPGSCPALENSQDSVSGRYPASAPASMEASVQRFTVPSPQMPGFDTNNHHMMSTLHTGENGMARFPGAQNMEMMKLPGLATHSVIGEQGIRFPCHSQQNRVFSPGQVGGVDSSVRFSGNAAEAVHRLRGPSPHGSAAVDMLHSRFIGTSPHVPGAENMSNQVHFNCTRPESMPSQSYSSPVQTITSNSSPCLSGGFNSENNGTHSHLHNLQKMTPPFDSIVESKVSSETASPIGSCASNPSITAVNASVAPYCSGSPSTPSAQVMSSNRLSHFDPIASMAAMSESTGGALANSVGNAQMCAVTMAPHLSISDLPVSNAVGISRTDAVNFNSSMQHPPQGILQYTSPNATSNQSHQFDLPQQMPHNIACGNSSFNKTAMPMQQVNSPNVITAAFPASVEVPHMNPHAAMNHHHVAGFQEGNSNTLSCSVTTNHPIMHSAVSAKPSNVNMCASGPRPNHLFPGQPVVQRNTALTGANASPATMIRASGTTTTPFNSTSIQVKASAPNTIQYLPARPQTSPAVSNRPPTLEFLQRFAAPLTNLDNKVPTHNLQYFPSSRGSSTPTCHIVAMTSTTGSVVPGMMNSQRPVNMLMGPMMRGTSSVPHAGTQMFPIAPSLPAAESPMFGRPHCAPVTQLSSPVLPVSAVAGAQNVSLFHSKQMPLPVGVMAPDATQPLPPSMGQSFNYKQSPFYGPTTADPNYAIQFHNFQQQLYATNTRGSQMNSQNTMSGQGFFSPK